LAWLDEILDRMRPGKYTDEVLRVARELLEDPLEAAENLGYLDLQSNRFLLGLLIKYRDQTLLGSMQRHLIDENGRLEPMAARYLNGVKGADSVPILFPLYRDNRLKDPWDQRAVRDMMLRHTGTEAMADELFRLALKRARDRSDRYTSRDMGMVLMSVYKTPKRGIQPFDLPPAVLRNRLRLLDSVKPMLSSGQKAQAEGLQKTIRKWLEPPS
jgi:hypothetical protein